MSLALSQDPQLGKMHGTIEQYIVSDEQVHSYCIDMLGYEAP